MIQTLRNILEGAVQRLSQTATNYVPALLAALTLVLVAWLMAVLVRHLIYRVFKGLALDRFLRQSGVAFVVDPGGRLRATHLVAEAAYWSILFTGALMGLNVFDTDLTSQMIQNLVFLLPKLVMAGAILLGGKWLGHYLGRAMLVWAVDENLPGPRHLATVTRILIMFVAVVVAADQLNFARSVFLAAFIILVGGAVLAASLAIGLRFRGVTRLWEDGTLTSGEADEQSLWNR